MQLCRIHLRMLSPIKPGILTSSNGSLPRALYPNYIPLSTTHKVFGQNQVTLPLKLRNKNLLSIDHPAFGKKKSFSSDRPFKGPVSISGFFLAIDPNFAAGPRNRMNPNAQLTVRDSEGNMSRVRYRCYLESCTGLKLEALIRLQVGWISPKVTFSCIPNVIHLGKGFDVSIPFLIHFTMVSMLDEYGDRTGGFLYFSGTPMFGFSAGLTQIKSGKLVLNPSRNVDPVEEAKKFVGKVHVRQLGFVFLKCLTYALCFLACIPASHKVLQYILPDPFHRHSESAMRKTSSVFWQYGAHIPRGIIYNGAKMKNWPEQQIPDNFKFRDEERFRAKAIPRDVGKIPRDFVLSVLYRHQPCEVSGLWEYCTNDPGIVLDSKKHLRDVLKQAREEGFITFERDSVSNEWLCFITRERYDEVRQIVGIRSETTETYSGLRGSSATETSSYAERFREMNATAKEDHLKRLQEEVASTTKHLRSFQRKEIDYLPYTDLNGKVNFMWWYETRDVQPKGANSIPASSDASLLGSESTSRLDR